MTDKPAAPSTAADFANPISKTTLDVPVSAAPKGNRLPIDHDISSAILALAINELRDDFERLSDTLDHLYVELGVRPPHAR